MRRSTYLVPMRRLAAPFRTPFFLFLLPVFFVAHGYVQNYGLLPGAEAVRLLLRYTAVAGALLLAGRWLCGGWRRGAMPAALLLASELFYGSMHDALRARVPGLPLSWAWILPLLLVIVVWAAWRQRRGRDPVRAVTFLNTLLLLLLVVEGGGWLRRYRARVREKAGRQWALRPATGLRPDVFLIVADEYASNRQLKEQLNFDNRPFLDSLRHRGFAVHEGSQSNYNYTEYSTASLLNGSYFPAASRTNATDVGRCFYWIHDNEAFRFFRAQDYELHNCSFFDLAGAPSPSPRVWNAQWTDLLQRQTLTARLRESFGPAPAPKTGNESVNETLLRATRSVLRKETTKPRFVYTHLLLPHSPYVYDSNGARQPAQVANDRSNTAAYTGYLQYGNRVYLRLVDDMLRQARRPTIVLLLGDHGYRFGKPAQRDYFFTNLFAVYTSPGLPGHWPEGAGMVNQFRLLLDSCFGQQLPLLPDERHLVGEQEP
ncbi:hypothetical protein E0486_10015 [Flaviaesturariibacter aridisoli]|uniref:Sulfatase N-terminal domain-containing protein n=2 Tax=Flaviaesturariibacter aridisoli TaxID=2545761 RepID=A0A4R4DZ88_9BACT|nr:hypothetical protein E0486_10015 [Flaviaesturariibacter aridisoli]